MYDRFNIIDNKKVESKELNSLSEKHCDSGYCISEYTINILEDASYEFKFKFTNQTTMPYERGCIKLYFSDVDYFVSCYKRVEAGAYVKGTIVMDKDLFSKYDDYQVINLNGEELEKNYKFYEENTVFNDDYLD